MLLAATLLLRYAIRDIAVIDAAATLIFAAAFAFDAAAAADTLSFELRLHCFATLIRCYMYMIYYAADLRHFDFAIDCRRFRCTDIFAIIAIDAY